MSIIPKAYAHVHQRNGDISALIHITPDDKPIAGENSIIHLGIQDNDENIATSNCDCKVIIQKDGKEVESYLLTQGEGEDAILYNAYVPVVFPTGGAYEIVLSGSVQSNHTQKPFSLTFVTRVENKKVTNADIILPFAGCIIVIVLLIVILLQNIFKKK